MQDQITIVYTPLHGTGNIPARRVMKELGFTHVYSGSAAGASGRRFPDRQLSEPGGKGSI